jgi:RNA polymerase sigma factor (TIGR02999 family)
VGPRTTGQPPGAEILPLVYDELRRLASAYMRRERADHTLQTTSLVHEAYLRLRNHRAGWRGKTHFFALAAIEMRRVLVEHARARAAQKRGGGRCEVTLDEDAAVTPGPLGILALDEALRRLARTSARRAAVAEYRIFAGLTEAEMAKVLGVSERTVREDWRAARAWLKRELAPGVPDST